MNPLLVVQLVAEIVKKALIRGFQPDLVHEVPSIHGFDSLPPAFASIPTDAILRGFIFALDALTNEIRNLFEWSCDWVVVGISFSAAVGA